MIYFKSQIIRRGSLTVALGVGVVCLSPRARAADPMPPAPSLATDAAVFVSAPPSALAAGPLSIARKGDVAVQSGDFALASRHFALAAEIAPSDPVVREMLGVALAAAGRFDQALPQFRRAVRLADDDPIATMLLQSEIAAQGDPNEAQALYLEVRRRFAPANGQGGLDTSRSVARLTARLRQQPDASILYLLLGDAYQLAENWPEADKAYRKAARLAPTWSKPLVNQGLAQLNQKRYDAAIVTFTEAVRLDPANSQAKVWFADAEMHGGRSQHAISLLRGVAADQREIAPAVREQAAIGLGQAYSTTREYSKAVASLDVAKKLAPADPTPLAMIGEVQLQAGNYEAATDAYQSALRLSENGSSLFADRSVLYRALAEAQISAHRADDALATLRHAMDADPASGPVWHRLIAQAQFDRGNPTAGQDELCQALDADADHYPFDTLNAIAARNLLPAIRTQYESLRDSSLSKGEGAVGVMGAVTIRIRPGIDTASQAKADQTRALSALANIARYQNRTAEEIELRRELTTLRTRATDWYLLAEVYDNLARYPIPAREAYGRALELKTGLSPAQITRATKRLQVLTGAAYKP